MAKGGGKADTSSGDESGKKAADNVAKYDKTDKELDDLAGGGKGSNDALARRLQALRDESRDD